MFHCADAHTKELSYDKRDSLPLCVHPKDQSSDAAPRDLTTVSSHAHVPLFTQPSHQVPINAGLSEHFHPPSIVELLTRIRRHTGEF